MFNYNRLLITRNVSCLGKTAFYGIISVFLLLFILSNFLPLNSFLTRNTEGLTSFQSNDLAKYTYISYVCADNNLERYGRDDINEMESGFNDSVTDVHVISLLDILNGGTTAYYISHDDNPSTITSTQLVIPGLNSEVNMGDPATLITFVAFCMTNYPAEHYVLDLWDHGSGWAICYDETSNDDALTMAELRTALQTINTTTGTRIDILCMDACLMGTLEVAYEIADYVDIFIASEETILVSGYPYDTIIADLCADSNQTITEFSSAVVDLFHASYSSFFQTTLSAVNLSIVDSSVFTDFALFAQNLHSYLSLGIKNELYNARVASEEFYDPDFVDLYDFTENTKNEASNMTIQGLAQNLMTSLSAAIINEKHHNHPGAHGLSIYFPEYQGSYMSSYAAYFSLSNDSMWDEFLQKYYISGNFGLTLRYYAVNDSLGNNNNTPDPGESLLIEIDLQNIGTTNAIDVNGTFLCLDSENVTVTSGPRSYGNILAGQNATQTFAFNISSSCAKYQHLSFVIMTQAIFNSYLIARNFTFELIVGRQVTLGGWSLASATEITSGLIYGILPGPGPNGVGWLKINCTASFYLFLNLTAPELTDFDVYVYNSAQKLISAAVKPNYPDECCFLIPQTSYYYLKLDPYSGGSCYYELFVNITSVAYEDGSSFGIAITLPENTLVNNSLPGPGAHGYFYYRISLSKDQRLRVFLEGPYATDFDLYIYDPNLRQVAQSARSSSSESCGLVASISGYYYILVVPYSGAGQFTLETKVEGFESFSWILILILVFVIVSLIVGLALYFAVIRRSRRNITSSYYDISHVRY